MNETNDNKIKEKQLVKKPGISRLTDNTNLEENSNYTFFYKQSIFDPPPKNCLSFTKKLPQKIV